MKINTLSLHVFSSKDEAGAQLTEGLNKVLQAAHSQNKPVLLLLSGGSAFDLLSQIDADSLTEKVTIGVLDERYSRDPKENNFAQLQETDFYTTAIAKGVQVIDTTVQGEETHEAHAKRFERALVAWKESNPEGVIVATVGIGPDGHTSGMLPFPENPSLVAQLFDDPDTLVAAYDAEGKNPFRYRSTTTNTFMKEYLDHAFVYAVGEGKRNALTRLISENGDFATTPARVLREMKSVDLFTDVTVE